MAVDTEYLRKLYASLSDDSLLAMNRDELVEAARQCYDDELSRRSLGRTGTTGRGELRRTAGSIFRAPEEEAPEWLEEAAQVYARTDQPGSQPAPDIAACREALEAADIPCHLAVVELSVDPSPGTATREWRLLVPGQLNLHATSILDRDVFNADFEAEWRGHLEVLSDDEVLALDPQETFCGLFDRIERVTRAYNEELERRGLE